MNQQIAQQPRRLRSGKVLLIAAFIVLASAAGLAHAQDMRISFDIYGMCSGTLRQDDYVISMDGRDLEMKYDLGNRDSIVPVGSHTFSVSKAGQPLVIKEARVLAYRNKPELVFPGSGTSVNVTVSENWPYHGLSLGIDNCGSSPTTPPVENESTVGDAVITDITGKVEVQPEQGGWVTPSVGERFPLRKVVRIHTGFRSTARIKMPKGVIELRPMSLLSIEDNGLTVRLRTGELKGSADELNRTSGAADDFNVKTPTLTTSRRGTIFTVTHDEAAGISTVAVEEGSVLVKPNNPSLRPVTLTAGQQVQVTQNRVGQVTPLVSENTDDQAREAERERQQMRNVLSSMLNRNASGRWVGNYTNSKGEGGKSTITINQLADGTITGDEDGWRIENGRRNGNSFTWQYLRQNNGCRDYQVALQLSNDGQTLTGTYQVTDRCASPATYSGRYVSYKRQ